MATQKKFLFRRQKLLLTLLNAFGGHVSKIDLQKYLFLFTQTCEQEKSYEFVPYTYGCFSFQSHADRRRLKEIGAIRNVEDWQLASGENEYTSLLDSSDQKKIRSFAEKYKNIKGDDVIRYVYKAYPYYAINSQIARNIMSSEELDRIAQARPRDGGYKFFTIGYEGRSFENYLNRLIKNNVKVLCDVRKNPSSRKYGFSRSVLSETLDTLGIEYVHMPELGIVSEKRQTLNTQDDYDRLFDDYENTTLQQNHNAVDKIFQMLLDKRRVAITCFEADPGMCHRSRIAKLLSKRPDWEHDIMHM